MTDNLRTRIAAVQADHSLLHSCGNEWKCYCLDEGNNETAWHRDHVADVLIRELGLTEERRVIHTYAAAGFTVAVGGTESRYLTEWTTDE